MKTFALKVQGLSKSFGSVCAVRRLSFSARRNAVTAILGENGAGKTTALKCTLGFLRNDAGVVDIGSNRIGYVPEHPVFFPWLKGGDILALTAAHPGGERAFHQELMHWCDRIPFDAGLLSRKARTYSLGNQKKFAYLQSLLIRPDLLVVDEPFSALDPVAIRNVRSLFLELRDSGAAVVLSSHIIAELEKVADDFLILKKGEALLQENLMRFKSENFLVQMTPSRPEKPQFARAASFVRDRELYSEMIVRKDRLASFFPLVDRKRNPAFIRELDLEKIFLFFAR